MSSVVTRCGKLGGSLLVCLVVLLAIAAAGGCAQKPAVAAYPTKAIEIVVPFAAGGTSDQVARILAPYIQKKWGQPASAVNKAGGGGTPGTVAVIQAPADGHTVGIVANSNGVLNDAVQKDLPYHWDSVTHVARINVTALVFTVKGDSKYNSLKELATDIQKDPSKFKYGSSGVAGPGTFAIAQLADAVGVDANKLDRVPFDGGAPAATATAGGHVDFIAQNLPEVLEMVKGGQLKALATTTPERLKDLPNVPTTKELGFASVNQMGLFGIIAPPNLPADIIKKWEDTLSEAMKDASFVADLEKIGTIPAYMSSSEFRPWMESEFKRSLATAEKLGIRK